MLNFFSLIAQQLPLGTIGQGTGLGPFSASGGVKPADILAQIVSKVIGVMTVAAGIWFMLQFLVGAFKWITSGGDKNNVEAAKEHLTHAVISLGIVVAAYVIAGLVGAIFGLDILNPQDIVKNLIFK